MTREAHFCTYFDHRYLLRGLALYASMRRHCRPFTLWVLCMDDECFRALEALALSDLVPLRLRDLEYHDEELHGVRPTRSLLEYYLTCTAAFMKWLLDTVPEIAVLTYLDADLFFYSSPNFLLSDFEGYSTLIVPHNFSKHNEWQREKYGIYNVGWVSFRRDVDGLACLSWWRRSCIEWCYDIVEEHRFADQKYLDQFAERFARVQIVKHLGVNLGPYNLENYQLSATADGTPLVDDQPVVFFHFTGLRRVTRFLWRTSHPHFAAPLDRMVRRLLYAPYLAELGAAEQLMRALCDPRARPLEYRGARVVQGRLRSIVREIVRLAVRGGGIWVVANRVL